MTASDDASGVNGAVQSVIDDAFSVIDDGKNVDAGAFGVDGGAKGAGEDFTFASGTGEGCSGCPLLPAGDDIRSQ